MLGANGLMFAPALIFKLSGIRQIPSMKSTLELLPRLSANPWFGSLPLNERVAVLSACEWLRLGPGELLFRQGDKVKPGSGALYCLVKGRLKVSSLREDGKEAILSVLEPGSWFGEIALIDYQPRPHDGTVLGPAELLALPRPAFDALMKTNAFSEAMCRLLTARMRLLYGLVEDATLRSTSARVARRLLLLARSDANRPHGARVMLTVSQEALAMMLGISRQTLNKELKALAGKGAIRLGYRRIEIESTALLERLGTAG
jgi:CRP/FNR family cyclic AMP-dependent transcriptional regulator